MQSTVACTAWKLPQSEDFDDGTKGTYEDPQNISLKVQAATSIGGALIGHFAQPTPLVHLDITSKAPVDGQASFARGPSAGPRIVVQRILGEQESQPRVM